MIHDFWRLLRIASITLLLTGLLAALGPAAIAQDSKGKSGAPTAEELKKLVKTLETDAERKKFLTTLKQLIDARQATAKPKPKADPFIDTIAKNLNKLGDHLLYAGRIITDAPAAWDWLVTANPIALLACTLVGDHLEGGAGALRRHPGGAFRPPAAAPISGAG